MNRARWIAAATLVLAITACAACGSDGGTGDNNVDASEAGADATANGADATTTAADAARADSAPAGFTLTSTAYADGGFIPTIHTCAGTNVSPALAWTGAPAGTLAYALIFIDIDNRANGFLHSIMWDIPVATASLPEAVDNLYEPSVPAGAKQTRSYSDGPRGYAGPCPGAQHTYEMRLHAVDTASLAGLDMATNMPAAKAAIENASLGVAVLSGEFDPNG